jgi:putative DNA primase/helicase
MERRFPRNPRSKSNPAKWASPNSRFREASKGSLKQWAIPARWFGGRGDEVLGELQALELSVHHKLRAEIVDYLAMARLDKHIGSTQSTGWYDEQTFVLPDSVIGTSQVWYQGGPVSASPYGQSGTLKDWQEQVAKRAIGKPNLIVALSTALAGPLLKKFNVEGGGLHWFGPTTIGKTTLLECGQSVWGGPTYRRSWRSTVNALEGSALLHTDTVLVLDEVHLVEARELDSAIYALVNGYGKGRADKLGGTKPVAHWRVLVLSSGEVSSEIQLAQGGINVRSGQILRFLDIPALGDFGVFDSLHGSSGGAAFADTLREAVSAHYGHAGPLFVRHLIESGTDLREDLTLVSEGFVAENDMQRRVARLVASNRKRWNTSPMADRAAFVRCTAQCSCSRFRF